MKSPPSRSPNTKFVFAVSVNSYLKYSAKKSQHLISSLAVQQNSFCDLFMKMSTFDTLKTVSGVFTKPPTVLLVFCVFFLTNFFCQASKAVFRTTNLLPAGIAPVLSNLGVPHAALPLDATPYYSNALCRNTAPGI